MATTDRTAQTRSAGWVTALIVVGFALLVCVRMPEIIIKGRFWAEEGAGFFQRAWVMPPWRAIGTPSDGYLNLVASTATVAARWFLPLPFAPYLTIGVGLFFQLVPPILLLTARDVWLRDIRVRLAAVLLILLIPESAEVWLQTLHCQLQLALSCGIILALDTCEGWASAFRFSILLLAPLCGPVAIALLPLFLLRAAIDRSRSRALQILPLGVGAGIQFFGFFTAVPGRAYELHPTILLSTVTVRHLALPFLGTAIAQLIAKAMRRMIQDGDWSLAGVLLPVAIFGGLLVAALRVGIRSPPIWLLAAGVLTAGASYFGALAGGVTMIDTLLGPRYTYVSQALFALSFLALAATSGRRLSTFAWAASVWLLVIGASEFFSPWRGIANGPAWRPEVAAWQADPNHTLQIWPTGWTMRLQPPQDGR